MASRYAAAVRRVLQHLEDTQGPAIDQAAAMVVEALTHGGAVFCSAIGHGTEGDFLNRAGGLAALQHFAYGFNLTDPVAESLKDRPRPEPFERDLETVRLAVRASNLRAGDVMLVGSVSGKNRAPIELALACRDTGVKVIALTAMAYTRQVQSLHPSGKRLFETADVTIDIGAPFGDAAADIPGIDVAVCPVSGVGFDVAGWLVWERVMETMAAAGDPPTVFMSVNREGGADYYQKARERYNQRGY